MSTANMEFQLEGWHAMVAALVLISIIAVRIISLNDMRQDEDLMSRIDALLMDEYLPAAVKDLQQAFEKGDNGKISNSIDLFNQKPINVISVSGSYPLFNFSSSKDVVVKVVFSIASNTRPAKPRTVYYLFRKGVAGWGYKHMSNAFRYYMNFT